jgi:hypothetical protein
MLAKDACNIHQKIIKKKKNHNRVQIMFTAVTHTLVQFSSQKRLIIKSYTDTHPCRSRAKPTNKQTNKQTNKHATTQEVEQEARKSVK